MKCETIAILTQLVLKMSMLEFFLLVVEIPKPIKPEGDPKSYRPLSLLCVFYQILEKLIYGRVEPIIDPLHGDLENTGYVNKKRARELKADKALSRCRAFSAQNCVNSKETFKANSHLCCTRNLRLMFILLKR